MLTGSVFNIGATKRVTSLVRYATILTNLAILLPLPPRSYLEETTIDIGGGWQISGTPMDMNDPRLLAIAEVERQFLEGEYEDYNASNASGAAFCRSVILILMALLLLRHAVTVPESEGDGDEDASTFLTLFLLRVAGFLLPSISWPGPSASCSVGGKDRCIFTFCR